MYCASVSGGRRTTRAYTEFEEERRMHIRMYTLHDNVAIARLQCWTMYRIADGHDTAATG